MLDTWYFCSAVRCSPPETQAFMAIVDQLRRSDDIRVVRAALRELDHAEPWMRAYASSEVIAMASRLGAARPEEAFSYLNELVDGLPPDQQAPLRAVVRELRRPKPFGDGAKAAERAARASLQRNVEAPSRYPYLDIERFTGEILLLSALSAAHDADLAAADVLDGDGAIAALVDRAVAGQLGRLAMLVGTRLAARAGADRDPSDLVRRLWSATVGVAHLEPDILTATARLLWGAVPLEAIEIESVTFTRLAQLTRQRRGTPSPERTSAALSRLGVRADQEDHVPLVLWHAVLWQLAAERDPEAAAARLERWWGAWCKPPKRTGRFEAPIGARPGHAWAKDLQTLFSLRDLKDDDPRPKFYATDGPEARWPDAHCPLVFSPWLGVRRRGWDLRPKSQPNFAGSTTPAALLRLFAAVMTTHTILRQPLAERPGHLVDLVMHAGDVLVDNPLRTHLAEVGRGELPSSPGVLERPLSGLALAAQRATDAIGRGYREEVPPEWFAGQLLDTLDTDQGYVPREKHALLANAAPFVVGGWLQEALWGVSGSRRDEPLQRWLADDPPLAERFLARLLRGGAWGRFGSTTNPHALKSVNRAKTGAAVDLHLHFPNHPFDRTPWDWRKLRHRGGAWRNILLSDELPPEIWETGWRDEDDLEARTRLALATERVASLLHENAREPDALRRRWIGDWAETLAAINDKKFFPRVVALRTTQLLRIPTDGHDWQRRIYEHLIDTLVEIGFGTPRVRWALFDALAAHALPPELAHALRLRAVQACAAAAPGTGSERDAIDIMDPTYRRRLARNAALLDELQRQLVLRHGSHVMVESGQALAEHAAEAWAGIRLSPSAHVHDLPDPSPGRQRAVDAIVVDRASAQGHVVTTRRSADPAATGVENLLGGGDHAAFAARLSSHPRMLAAVVAGEQPEETWLNVAPGLSVTTSLRPRDGVGSIVQASVVRHGADPSGMLIEKIEPIPAADAEPGDCRLIDVTATPSSKEAQISIGGDKLDDLPADLVLRWWPDTSRSFDPQPGTWRSLARWTGSAWEPVDRTFTELVAAELAAGRRQTTLTVVADHEDDGRVAWRVATEPGTSFVVAVDDLVDGDGQRLQDACEAAGDDPWGLLVHVAFVDDEDGVRLALRDERGRADSHRDAPAAAAFDDRNVRWRTLFDDDGPHVADRDDGRWRVRIGLSGYPDTITVVGLDHLQGLQRCQLDDIEWGPRQQRRATVEARPVETYALTSPSGRAPQPERDLRTYREIRDYRRGSRIHLRSISPNVRGGRAFGWTPANLLVQVDAESVSMLAVADWPEKGNRRQRQTRDRSGQIEHVGTRDPVAVATRSPITSTYLVNGLDPDLAARTARAIEAHGTVDGLIVEVPRQLDADGVAYLGVWLDLGEEAGLVRRNVELAPGRSGKPNTGDLVQLELDTERNEWRLEITPRWFIVRALWREVDELPTGQAVALGTAEVDGRDVEILQHTELDDVAFVDPGHGTRRARRSVPDLAGKKATTHGGQYPRSGTRGRWQRVVAGGGLNLAGETRAGSSDATTVARAEVTAERVDGRWISLRRELFLTDARPSQRRPPTSPEHQKQRAFDRYLSDPDGPRPLDATVVGDVAELHDLEVPTAAGWARRVPLLEGEAPWVENDTYPRDEARVLLVDLDGAWHASFRQVPPSGLDEFVETHGLAIGTPVDLSPELTFAGFADEPDDVVRFEWGYGRTMHVPLQDVRVEGEETSRATFPLFFGDVLRRASVSWNRRSDRQATLHIDPFAPGAIKWSDGRHTYVQAKEHNIVHLLDVTIDGRRGSARVDGVAGWRERIQEADAGPVRSLVVPNASLDRESANRLVRHAGAGDGARSMRVFGYLDHERFERSRGRQVVFTYLEATLHRSAPHRLQEQHRIFMRAADLEVRDNDVVLTCELPPEVERPDKHPLTARVTRRRFSHRESLLRNVADESDSELLGRTFLVQLVETTGRGAGAVGATLNPPARSWKVLRSILRNVGQENAVVIRRRKDETRVELDANVVFAIPDDELRASEHLPRHGVVRLWLDDEDHINAQPALSPDEAFIGDTGRGAVLLPTDGLLHRGRTDHGAVFSIGGLPNITAKLEAEDERHAIGELLYAPHPRVGVVRRSRASTRDLVVRPDEPLNAATVSVDDQLRPVLRPHGASDPPAAARCDWPQLTFADVGAAAVAERLRREWSYHDRSTGQWRRRGGERSVRTQDIARRTAEHEPLFFDREWRLRYRRSELAERALPSSALLDDRRLARNGDTVTVARRVVKRTDGQNRPVGLWVEISPGRVVELRGDLLSIETGSGATRSLADLYWKAFAPGDEIDLRVRRRRRTEVGRAVLVDWRPGVRRVLGRRALLPVCHVDEASGALHLGAGHVRLQRPRSRAAGAPATNAVWLDADNNLSEATPGTTDDLRPGDVVIIRADDRGALTVCGTDLPARPSPRSWGAYTWLRDLLADDGRGAFLDLVGGALAVTVDDVAQGEVRFGYRAQELDIPAGVVVPAQALTVLSDGQAAVLVGGTLVRVRRTDVVRGLPAAVGARVFRDLAESRALLWLHAGTDGRLRPGLDTRTDGAEVTVEPIDAYQGDDGTKSGVVCRDVESKALAWLPSRETGWFQPTFDELRRHVADRRDGLRALQLNDGRLSLKRASAPKQRRSVLTVGQPLHVRLLTDPSDLGNGRYRYLGRLHMTDVLVEVESSSPSHQPSDDPLPVEVAWLAPIGDDAGLVERRHRRTAIDLPTWMTDPDLLHASVPERFAAYGEWFDGGRRGTTDPPDDLHPRVVHGAGQLLGHGWSEPLERVAKEWLDADASSLLATRDGVDHDLVPLLAAIVLVDGRARRDHDPGWHLAAVHLTRHLSLRAARSRHIEPLVTHVVSRPDDELRRGPWQRLAHLCIPGNLDEGQAVALSAFADGMLTRTSLSHDRALRDVAIALHAALGRVPSPDELVGLPGRLQQLVQLGHALAPAGAAELAQRELLPPQRQSLEVLLLDLLRNAVPLTLLPLAHGIADTELEAARTAIAELV